MTYRAKPDDHDSNRPDTGEPDTETIDPQDVDPETATDPEDKPVENPSG